MNLCSILFSLLLILYKTTWLALLSWEGMWINDEVRTSMQILKQSGFLTTLTYIDKGMQWDRCSIITGVRTWNWVPDIELYWRWYQLINRNTLGPIVPPKTLQLCLLLVCLRPQAGYPAAFYLL